MVIPTLYTIVVWYLAARWRRTRAGAALLVLSLVPVTAALVATARYAGEGPVSNFLGLSVTGYGRVMAIVTIMYGVLLQAIGWFIYSLPRARAAHQCPACGYDLRGTPGPACPECGSVPTAAGA